MDRVIYLAMAGAKANMQRQDVLSHNLANASTTGFRAELTAFRAVPVLGNGASTRVYSIESTPGYNPDPGPVTATGKITAIDAKAGTLTLDHEAIPALDWPPMTMTFKVRHPDQLNGLKAGDQVRIEVNTQPEGDDYVIDQLHKESAP